MDQNLPYQQNLPAFELAVVVLEDPSNAFPNVVELMPDVEREDSRDRSGTGDGRVRTTPIAADDGPLPHSKVSVSCTLFIRLKARRG